MTVRPILFSAPMVRTLLAGSKTQTRRVVKPQPVVTPDGYWNWSPHRAQGLYHGQGSSVADLPLQDATDPSAWWEVEPGKCQARTPEDSYRLLWESINDPGSWAENPWVWAVSFSVEQRNVDA